MDNNLKILLLIYSIILIVNAVSSFVMWKQNKDKLYLIAYFIWISCLINFALQAIFQGFDTKMLLAYSTYLVVSVLIMRFFFESLKQIDSGYIKKEKAITVISLFLIILGLTFQVAVKNYFLSSIIVSIGISIPMFFTCIAIYGLKEKRTNSVTSFGFLILINALHFLDYPFLRPYPETAVAGYTIALLILFSMSIFIPAFIVHQLTTSYSSKLEKEVENKTKELALLIQDKRALLSLVCHDLANPLQALKIFTEKVKKSLDNNDIEASKYNLQKVFKSFNHASELLTKVRELQSVKDGKLTLDIKPIEVLNVLSETLDQYEEFLNKKSLALEISAEGNLKVMADEVILRNEIFGNLISNAIKFSKFNSRISIHIIKHNQFAKIKIQDSGIGMPKEILDNLFSFEHKTNRIGTNEEKGTGLGLPVLKKYLELMNGTIAVSSISIEECSTNHGSSFEIELPLTS